MQHVANQVAAAIDIHSSRARGPQQHSISRCLRSNIFQFQLAVVAQLDACFSTAVSHVQTPAIKGGFRTTAQLDADSTSTADLHAAGTI